MGGQVNLGKISKRTVCFQQNLALDNAIAPVFKAYPLDKGVKEIIAWYKKEGWL